VLPACCPRAARVLPALRPNPSSGGRLQGNERLLKMYESGLPTWAIFMPAYGFYYRQAPQQPPQHPEH
jgi:hypothetical protein